MCSRKKFASSKNETMCERQGLVNGARTMFGRFLILVYNFKATLRSRLTECSERSRINLYKRANHKNSTGIC